MKGVISAAVQCNGLCSLFAILLVCLTIIVLAILAVKCVKMVLSTISRYHDATLKIGVDSVNAELNLHNKR